MSTVFSHIIQRRYSQEYENIATDALAFIVQSSPAARTGLMKVLRGIAPDLPNLQFRTQQSKGSARPDMGGYDDLVKPRVFLENKFWAGLTENQPVVYLRLLEECPRPAVLLVVVPVARQGTVWHELRSRLRDAQVGASEQEPSVGLSHAVTTDAGPILALTSWAKLLSAIEAELTDEPRTLNDLLQLRALCDAADSDAFVPLSAAELTDQRTPAFILQMSLIVQRVVDHGVAQGFLKVGRLKPMSNWEQIGRYMSFVAAKEIGAWIGTDFLLWRSHGRTPLWLRFPAGDWGHAAEVRTLLEPWAESKGLPYAMDNDWMAVGIDLVTGEELDLVVKSVADRLKEISEELSRLPPVQG